MASTKALVFLKNPIRISTGVYDCIYCWPSTTETSPIGSNFPIVLLGGSVAEDAYAVPRDNISCMFYSYTDDTAADASVALIAAGVLSFLDLTV